MCAPFVGVCDGSAGILEVLCSDVLLCPLRSYPVSTHGGTYYFNLCADANECGTGVSACFKPSTGHTSTMGLSSNITVTLDSECTVQVHVYNLHNKNIPCNIIIMQVFI